MIALAVVVAVVVIAAAALLGGVGALPVVLMIVAVVAGGYFLNARARRQRMASGHAGTTSMPTGVRGFTLAVVAGAVIFLLLVMALIWRSAWWPA